MMSSSKALLAATVRAPPSCSGSSSATTICSNHRSHAPSTMAPLDNEAGLKAPTGQVLACQKRY